MDGHMAGMDLDMAGVAGVTQDMDGVTQVTDGVTQDTDGDITQDIQDIQVIQVITTQELMANVMLIIQGEMRVIKGFKRFARPGRHRVLHVSLFEL